VASKWSDRIASHCPRRRAEAIRGLRQCG